MNVQDSWKRTDETEIDLADLLKRLCMRWKQILICALASAVLAGGYGYVKNSVKIQDAQTAAETELTEEEAQRHRDLIDHTTQLYWPDDELSNIVWDSLGPYFAGDWTLDHTIDIIQSRATLYVNEQR